MLGYVSGIFGSGFGVIVEDFISGLTDYVICLVLLALKASIMGVENMDKAGYTAAFDYLLIVLSEILSSLWIFKDGCPSL